MKRKIINTFLICAMFTLCIFGSTFLLYGCGPKNYDLTKISFNNATVNYDGTAKYLKLEGTLPEGLEVNYKYYTDSTYETEAANTVDVGTYYVRAIFTAAKGYNTPDPFTATLTINKVDFADVELSVVAYNDGNETAIPAKLNSDGSLYFEANNVLYERITVTNNKNANQEVKFYKDEALTVEAPAALQNYGQKVYAKVTLSDKNHNSFTRVLELKIERKTLELSTYEDLLTMYKHVHGPEPLNQTARQNIRYLLVNDIDCSDDQGKPRLWKSIGGCYGEDFFCSEFDGNNHTISNLKYTIESVDKDSAYANDGLFVSFFGNAYDCDIHNVTFSNVSIEINAGDFERVDHELWGAQNPLYAAVVVGRLESAQINPEKPQTFVHDITVKNCNIKVDAFKMYVGAIIAKDQVTDSEVSVRDNLHVENCNIYAISTEYMDSMWVGGITGQLSQSAGYLYTNCSVKNLKIGFDYESYSKATTKLEKNKYISLVNEAIVGGFVGTIATPTKFVNCTLDNYLIASTRKTGYYCSLTSTVEFENCTHTQSDVNWNEIKGVYNYEDKVDESNLNWNNATYVKPQPQPAQTTLSTNKTEYTVGEKIVVFVTAESDYVVTNDNLSEAGNWWIAFFRKGDFDVNQDSYLGYSYLLNFDQEGLNESFYTHKNLQGKKSFFLLQEAGMYWNGNPAPSELEAGDYELVLFNGYASPEVYNVELRVDFSIVAE